MLNGKAISNHAKRSTVSVVLSYEAISQVT